MEKNSRNTNNTSIRWYGNQAFMLYKTIDNDVYMDSGTYTVPI